MSSSAVLASNFCRLVTEQKGISNATARLCAWLIGVSDKTGGFPLELSLRQITDGFEHNGVKVIGTGSREETIRASLAWLEEHGFLQSTVGRQVGFGHAAGVYHLEF